MERTSKDGLADLAGAPSDDRRGDCDRGADGSLPGAGGLRADSRLGATLYHYIHAGGDANTHRRRHANTLGFTSAISYSERRRQCHTLNTP